MNGASRRAIGSLAILAFLVIYIGVVATLGGTLADAPGWAQLAYYAIAGTAWGLPLWPLFKWMGKRG
ncbi:MAG: DUF2842 domain-containing protein [Caulobacterales bacterium]